MEASVNWQEAPLIYTHWTRASFPPWRIWTHTFKTKTPFSPTKLSLFNNTCHNHKIESSSTWSMFSFPSWLQKFCPVKTRLFWANVIVDSSSVTGKPRVMANANIYHPSVDDIFLQENHWNNDNGKSISLLLSVLSRFICNNPSGGLFCHLLLLWFRSGEIGQWRQRFSLAS